MDLDVAQDLIKRHVAEFSRVNLMDLLDQILEECETEQERQFVKGLWANCPAIVLSIYTRGMVDGLEYYRETQPDRLRLYESEQFTSDDDK